MSLPLTFEDPVLSETDGMDDSITLNQFLDVQPSPLRYEQVSFDHPIYILYS